MLPKKKLLQAEDKNTQSVSRNNWPDINKVNICKKAAERGECCNIINNLQCHYRHTIIYTKFECKKKICTFVQCNAFIRHSRHSSEIKGLRSTKCSSKTLQNLLYFMYKKTRVVFFVFHFMQL